MLNMLIKHEYIFSFFTRKQLKEDFANDVFIALLII